MKKSEFKELLKECMLEVLPVVLKETFPNGISNVSLSEGVSSSVKNPTVIGNRTEVATNAAKLAGTMHKGNSKLFAQVMSEAATRTGDRIQEFEKAGGVPPEIGAVETTQLERLGGKPQNWMKLALSSKAK